MTDRFGTWPWLSEVVTTWGPAVTIAAWGSILLQLSFPFLLLTRPTRIIGLVGILGFHIAIAVLMGLPWFSLSMIAIDAIFIRDRTWREMTVGFLERFRSSQARITGEAPPDSEAAAEDTDEAVAADHDADTDVVTAAAAPHR